MLMKSQLVTKIIRRDVGNDITLSIDDEAKRILEIVFLGHVCPTKLFCILSDRSIKYL